MSAPDPPSYPDDSLHSFYKCGPCAVSIRITRALLERQNLDHHPRPADQNLHVSGTLSKCAQVPKSQQPD